MGNDRDNHKLITKETQDACVAMAPAAILSTLSTGTSVFAQAVIDHNIQTVARLYTSISFARLGALLGISPLQAEKTVARLWTQKQIKASLDGVAGSVHFPQRMLM